MGILEVHNLELQKQGNKILDDLTLDLREGHIHALIGPNGAGKSTLAHSIMGLHGYADVAGDMRFEGDSIKDLTVDERARRESSRPGRSRRVSRVFGSTGS